MGSSRHLLITMYDSTDFQLDLHRKHTAIFCQQPDKEASGTMPLAPTNVSTYLGHFNDLAQDSVNSSALAMV